MHGVVWLILITIVLEITTSGLPVTSCQMQLVGEAEEGWVKKGRRGRLAQWGTGPEADIGNGFRARKELVGKPTKRAPGEHRRLEWGPGCSVHTDACLDQGTREKTSVPQKPVQGFKQAVSPHLQSFYVSVENNLFQNMWVSQFRYHSGC